MSSDGLPRFSQEVWAAFSSPTRLSVLLVLEQRPGTASDVAGVLGSNASRQSVQVHINALTEAGLVRASGERQGLGGTAIVYDVVHRGWADAIATVNAVVSAEAGA